MVSHPVTGSPAPVPVGVSDRVDRSPHDGRGRRSLVEEHAVLLDEVRRRQGAVLAGLDAGRFPRAELAALVAYLRCEVLDQAATEESLLFPAARPGSTDDQVHGLAVDHGRIRDVTDRLADLAAVDDALGAREPLVDLLDGLDGLLETHMRTEQSVLTAAPGVESLRWPFRCHLWFPLTEGPEFDLDDLPRASAHSAALDRLSRLRPGESVLVRCRDDLQPLWVALSRAHPDEFGWVCLDEGPTVWRARITRRTPA
jgi:uncharacterized protein (DUF2249 family)/hemerythrin-like domain-containing protein